MQIYQLTRNKKHAFSSIVEITVVIMITTAISLMAINAVKSLVNSHTVYKISQEATNIFQAIQNFKNAYTAFPGDLPCADLSNGKFSGGYLQTNCNTIMTTTPATSDDIFTMPLSRHINIYKAQLAFAQMVKAEFLDYEIDMNYQLPAKCNALSSAGGKTLPISRPLKISSWVIAFDTSSYVVNTANQTPQNSVAYTSDIYPNVTSKIKLVLFNNSSIANCTIDVNSGIGAVSSSIAYMLDLKIDDGMPSSAQGKVIADAAATNKCKTTVATGASITSSQYQDNSDNTRNNACVLTFIQ
ncbi:hypothetical protein [Candidatus Deianiraea vastatrix]|uniref:Uncharacterized protein n=1 Tax=Candidatus Deianiraea vastatrix TaxID=2163644 RepID=A0A5B8XGE0_9RICK|nr:hypothetical protein [Candidatus Deianiraea vastatrix]QED23936.1 hypothetical protein Deia_01158 [Candidatus Deianiraea vastatrix]